MVSSAAFVFQCKQYKQKGLGRAQCCSLSIFTQRFVGIKWRSVRDYVEERQRDLFRGVGWGVFTKIVW